MLDTIWLGICFLIGLISIVNIMGILMDVFDICDYFVWLCTSIFVWFLMSNHLFPHPYFVLGTSLGLFLCVIQYDWCVQLFRILVKPYDWVKYKYKSIFINSHRDISDSKPECSHDWESIGSSCIDKNSVKVIKFYYRCRKCNTRNIETINVPLDD